VLVELSYRAVLVMDCLQRSSGGGKVFDDYEARAIVILTTWYSSYEKLQDDSIGLNTFALVHEKLRMIDKLFSSIFLVTRKSNSIPRRILTTAAHSFSLSLSDLMNRSILNDYFSLTQCIIIIIIIIV